MTTDERIASALRRISQETTSLQSYQTAFITNADISRIVTDSERLQGVLAISDAHHIETPEDLAELRERLNALRASISSVLVSAQNLHEKAEAIDLSLSNLENLVDNEDEAL